VNRPMTGRPRPGTLVASMFEVWPKLSDEARRYGAEQVRCAKRHLLATIVRHPYGTWLHWRGHPAGKGWVCAWADEIDPAVLTAWCSSCRDTWEINASDPRHPRRHALG
jgi:hypothetical protein